MISKYGANFLLSDDSVIPMYRVLRDIRSINVLFIHRYKPTLYRHFLLKHDVIFGSIYRKKL